MKYPYGHGLWHPDQRCTFTFSGDTNPPQFIGSVADFDIIHMCAPTPITFVMSTRGGQWVYIWNVGEWQRDWDVRKRCMVPQPPRNAAQEQIDLMLHMVRMFATNLPEQYRHAAV